MTIVAMAAVIKAVGLADTKVNVIVDGQHDADYRAYKAGLRKQGAKIDKVWSIRSLA